MSDEEVIAELIKIKGIGVWTAQMFLMFALGRPNVFPHDDLGVKTAINLRAFHRDDKLVKGLDITLVRIPFRTWHIHVDDVAAALKAIRSGRERGPVLLHCQHGADRTGLITALYRTLYQGWPKEDALKEMKQGDFGYHRMWTNISAFLTNADIAFLRQMVEKP